MARRLLAILAAAPGRVIRTDQILDQLWPETRPATANKTLQTHIVHLRRALGPNAIAHRSGGYLLATAVVALDARDLEALAQQAENAVADGRIDEASGALESAVRLLRGMPFDEFAVDEFAIAEVARSQELAWRAIELRAECAIEKGTAPAAISYLERLVAEQPLRESAWTVLIQAQVAAGRRGDATRTAERARASLRKSSGQGPDRPYGRPRRRFRSRSPTWLPSNRFLRVSLRSASPRCGVALMAGVAQRFVDDGASRASVAPPVIVASCIDPSILRDRTLIEDRAGPGAASAALVDAGARTCSSQSPSRPSRPPRMTSAAACGSSRRASTSARSPSN